MNPEALAQHIEAFFGAVGHGQIDIYNEFSLQHEFGVWLREHTKGSNLKFQFERPARFFGIERRLTKKEIDLACIAPPQMPMMAVEFKFPRAGQVPIQMFKFCQDVAFIEELVLKEQRFPFGCAIIAADDADFYRGSRHKADAIYSCFRDGVAIKGTIVKSTGKEEPPVELLRQYQIEWQCVPNMDALKYALVMISQ